MQFQLFLKNSYGVLFFLFFLFQLAMSSLAMLVCTLMHKTSVAVYVGFAVFLLGECCCACFLCMRLQCLVHSQGHTVVILWLCRLPVG